MNKTILQRVKKSNYITDYFTSTSGYLTPDGDFVHLISKQDEDRGGWYREDHRTISRFMNQSKTDYSGTEKMCKIMKKYGWIRVKPETDQIGFEFAKKPTKWQVRAIATCNKYGSVLVEQFRNLYSNPIEIGNLRDFIDWCDKHHISY